jgi:hypothetical protein
MTDCAYNTDTHCHAIGITVAGNKPSCTTMMASSHKGGIMELEGGVGACKVEKCSFNKSLECTAQKIELMKRGSAAECRMYQPR